MAVTAKRPFVVNLMASGKYLIVLLKYKGTRQNWSTKVSGDSAPQQGALLGLARRAAARQAVLWTKTINHAG
jgi:hypothetical protein